MRNKKLILASVIAAAFLVACGKSNVSVDSKSVRVSDGTSSGEVTTAANSSSVRVDGGNAAIVVGDAQQNQSGVGQENAVEASAADGRSVTMTNGQIVLQREGVGTIVMDGSK